jgi:hypothetical protein
VATKRFGCAAAKLQSTHADRAPRTAALSNLGQRISKASMAPSVVA